MKRVGLSSCIAVFVLAIAASGAWACNAPSIGGSPTGGGGPNGPVHPGDSVSYTITDLSAGAEYSVFVGSQAVTPTLTAGGDGAVSDTFTMPDLGDSSHDVSLEVLVHHGDIENPEQSLRRTAPSPLRYTVDEPAPAESQQQAPAETPAPASAPAAATAEGPSGQDSTGAPTLPRGPAGGGAVPAAPAAKAPQHVLRSPAATQPAARGVVHGQGRSAAVQGGTPIPQSMASPRAIPTAVSRALNAVGHRQTVHDARTTRKVEVGPPLRTSSAPAARARVSFPRPERAMLVVILLFAVVGAIVAFTLRLRRSGGAAGAPTASPEPPRHDGATAAYAHDLAVEAELQEIIAEGRARDSTTAVAHFP